jgi:ABC-type transporter Mla subunit MlaD
MSQVPLPTSDLSHANADTLPSGGASPAQAQALLALSAQVLPVWARQLASSRSQSETAVAEMLSAFAEIGPHLDMASRQSKQISAALAQGQDGITQLAQSCDQVLQPVLGACTPEARAAIGQVMAMIHATVDAIEEIAKPFERETQMVSQQVERMYKGFQYQDRISQMMTLLHEDIERLQAALQTPAANANAADWLARLESQYVMTDQRQQHTDGTAAAAVDDDEPTFF